MTAPSVFISYSHDSAAHKEWVLKLATDLRARGVDTSLDQWDLVPGQDVAAFMAKGISTSDRVLMICSETYVRKAEAGAGGVAYERLIVTAELVQNIETKKFIPVVRANTLGNKTPAFLGPRLFVDFSSDDEYAEKLTELLRELLGVPSTVKPPIGPNPFSGSVPPIEAPPRIAGPTGRVTSGEALLEDAWFRTQAASATERVVKAGFSAHLELRFGPHSGLARSQIELLNAVRKSEIKTFGWPIGVNLESREEYRPRPFEDGIRAEVAIGGDTLSGSRSYDYWALRGTGDFYLLQSLFEDERADKVVYFNTRIVRVTEAMLFAANLYTNLGAAPETKISIRVTHRGLAGRRLTSSSPNRPILQATTTEHQSQVEHVVVLGQIQPLLVEIVRRITSPMFMLFDYTEFSEDVYSDIVRRFEKGEVT